MQCLELLDSGVYVPLGKVQPLPSGIILDAGNTLSSILSSATQVTSLPASVSPAKITGANLNIPLPQPGKVYNAVVFQFLRDGSTNLPLTANLLLAAGGPPWFMTLHNMNDGDTLTTAPHNFFSVQIDPSNGHMHTFRP